MLFEKTEFSLVFFKLFQENFSWAETQPDENLEFMEVCGPAALLNMKSTGVTKSKHD